MNKQIVEEMKNLKEKMNEVGTANSLKGRVQEIQRRLAELEPEITKSEIKGGTPEAKSMKEEREKLEAEMKELERRLPYVDDVRKELQNKYDRLDADLRDELIKESWPEYQKLAEKLAMKWRETEKAEIDLVILIETVYANYREAGGQLFSGVLPYFRRVLSDGNVIALASNPNFQPPSISVVASNADLLCESLQQIGIRLPKGIAFDKEDRLKTARTLKPRT